MGNQQPAVLSIPEIPGVYSAYYYIRAWLEKQTDYENVIAQSPNGEGISGALQTFELYLEKEYGHLLTNRDYFIEEITLLDLPIITRHDVEPKPPIIISGEIKHG